MGKETRWLLVGVLALGGAARADDETWAARAALGYSKTSGNTDTTTFNYLAHAAHVIGDWKLLGGISGVYGSTQGETTAQSFDGYLQANYNITPRFYWYGGLKYDDDHFSGFAYQESLATGVGYQFVKSDATKLSAQIGVGARQLQQEILVKDAIGGIVSSTKLPATTDAVLDAAANYEHAFNSSTKLLVTASLDAGSTNTLTVAVVSLQVKMSSLLALSIGYQYKHNSNPPTGSVGTDTLTTVNLVYELKNPKLAPE
ncbi:MAG TPA: DUF481 domain-containing protein [Steroidobacteraceae bacterium]|nr:DUF481 domain-containing protein [Steroidobacteraceae bacterium]